MSRDIQLMLAHPPAESTPRTRGPEIQPRPEPLGDCYAPGSVAVVEGLCLGQSSCTVPATSATFGDPCGD